MAALSERHPAGLVELARIAPSQMSTVLDEETAEWSDQLHWDFGPSAELVRRFVHMHALNGFALMRGPRVIGYSYYVSEESKGLIGDVYVLKEHRTAEAEDALLEAGLAALWRTPGVHRAESQLMMISSPLHRSAPYRSWFRAFPRYFLEAELETVAKLPRKPSRLAIAGWTPRLNEETAHRIAEAYRGHIDSQINDQYRSAAGARRFLTNIVQFPGCGSFFAPASYAATEEKSGALGGVSLASLVAADAGHITQVCVAPRLQGSGLGYELVRRSLLALAAHGCKTASLTVTASNASAVRLYERMGFVKRRDFAAYVWESR